MYSTLLVVAKPEETFDATAVTLSVVGFSVTKLTSILEVYQPFVPFGVAMLFVTLQVGAVLSSLTVVFAAAEQFPAASQALISNISERSFVCGI